MDDTAVDEGDRRAMKYSWDMWLGGTQPLNLNPGTGDWPGLPFYLTLGSQIAYRGYDLVRRPGASAESFRDRVTERPAGIFLAARLPSVALGVLSVYLIYLLALQLAGPGVGLLAAGFMAVMPFHVLSSQRVSDPNLLSLVFMTAASIFMLRLMRTRALRDSILAGVFVGLAGASKYVPLVMLAPLALAHLGDPKTTSFLRIRWKALMAAFGASLLTFALASPFTILDGAAKLRDMRTQQVRVTTEWAGISTHAGSLLTYLTKTIPEMLTWVGYLLALLGCVLLWLRGREGRVVVLVPIVFVLGVGTLGLAQPRFVFPALGSLVVALAISVIWIDERLGQRRAPPGRGAILFPSLVLAGFAVWGAATAVATQRQLSKPDSRHAAYKWTKRSIGPNEMLGLDAYGPVLGRGPDGRRAVAWPFNAFHTAAVRAAFHPEWLDGIRYYMMSSEVTRRFDGSDPQYAKERGFYEWIRRHGRKAWGTDTRATSGPQIDMYELPRSLSRGESRDSLWEEERRAGGLGVRIALWTSDLSEDFLLAGDPARAEEWARRGLTLPHREARQALLETFTLALLQQGKAAEAETAALAGSAQYPGTPLLHVFRAMALEALSRDDEAIEEYRLALPLGKGEARQYIAGAIDRLEAKGR